MTLRFKVKNRWSDIVCTAIKWDGTFPPPYPFVPCPVVGMKDRAMVYTLSHGILEVVPGDWLVTCEGECGHVVSDETLGANYTIVEVIEKEEDTVKVGIESHHRSDEQGNPRGGTTTGRGFSIEWQDGPLMEDGVRREPTGAFVEDVIEAAADRIRYYQASKFSCRENSIAITKLEEAILWLQKRTNDRIARGVEGTNKV